MRTVAVTAGVRYWYAEAAMRLTNRFNRLAAMIDDGFECINASRLIPWDRIKDHRFCKAYIWDAMPSDVDRVMWIDCDCFQTRPIGLHELPDAPFAATRDTNWCAEQTREVLPGADEVVSFFNAGVLLCKLETRDIFDQVKAVSDALEDGGKPGGDHGDQPLWNLFVARKYKDFVTNPTGWTELPAEYNAIKGKDGLPTRPTIVHLAGVWEQWYYLDMLYKGLEEAERFIMKK